MSSTLIPKKSGTYLIGPELAQAILDRLAKFQRPLRKSNVEKLVSIMRAGLWIRNGSPIVLAEDEGGLLDGQHRMRAVIEVGEPQEFDVIVGIPNARSAYRTLGDQAPRTLGDTLKMDGWVEYNYVAGTLIWLWKHANNMMASKSAISQSILAKFLRDRLKKGALITAVQIGRDAYGTGLRPRNAFAFAYYILHDWDAKTTEDFFTRLITNDSLKPGTPIHYLRQRLQGNTVLERSETLKVITLIFKCWKLYRNDSNQAVRNLTSVHDDETFINNG